MQSNKLSKQKNYKEILKGHNDVILVIEIFDQSRLKSISSDGSFRGYLVKISKNFYFLRMGSIIETNCLQENIIENTYNK